MLTAEPVSESEFSLFGLNEVESYTTIAMMCIFTLLIIIVFIFVVTKRKLRLRVRRGENSAEISMNESAQPMMNSSVVSRV